MAHAKNQGRAALPDLLDRQAHLEVARRGEWVARRLVLALLVATTIAGLANLFGQRPASTAVTTPRATLSVVAPSHVRGGLFFEGRFTVVANETFATTELILGRGWLEGLSINTIEPAPVREESRDGGLALDFGRLSRRERLVVYMQFQVNPTNVGRRRADVDLSDGREAVAHLDRQLTVYP